jgi:beta-phosphoglucomutase-like phosphatase (HAD superfamily)
MPATAILDIAGTLVDTNYQHTLAWYRAFRQHDILLPIYSIHRHVGMGGDQIVPALAGEEIERATRPLNPVDEEPVVPVVVVGSTDGRGRRRHGARPAWAGPLPGDVYCRDT